MAEKNSFLFAILLHLITKYKLVKYLTSNEVTSTGLFSKYWLELTAKDRLRRLFKFSYHQNI